MTKAVVKKRKDGPQLRDINAEAVERAKQFAAAIGRELKYVTPDARWQSSLSMKTVREYHAQLGQFIRAIEIRTVPVQVQAQADERRAA